MLRFQADDHTYWLGDEKLPGVTGVIEDACLSFAKVPEKYLVPAQWRGTVVHKATELSDLGVLDWDSLDADLHGYVESWQQFVKHIGFDMDLMEHQVWHSKFKYAGTLDRAGTVKWKKARRKAIIDIKTGAPVAGTALQTAAYQAALKDMGEGEYKLRLGVHVKVDGSAPNVVEYGAAQDLSTFLAMLKVYRWKLNN